MGKSVSQDLGVDLVENHRDNFEHQFCLTAPVLAELHAALRSKSIQVSDETEVEKMLNAREWIYPSQLVITMQKKLNFDCYSDLCELFDYQHHIESAAKLFRSMKSNQVAVIYGNKAQGKSQFLYFVFKLLKSLDEKVVFLDRTILPSRHSLMDKLSEEPFCVNMWRDSFMNTGEVEDCLNQFYENLLPGQFGKFLSALRKNTKKSGKRVWIIIDEVVLFENFPIDLPEEQDIGPFHWIITGSARIGLWVSERHLNDYIFDLPLFTKTEIKTFSDKLSGRLNIDLAAAIAIPEEGVEDWLEERFGGVIGYVTEIFLELSEHSVGEACVSKLMIKLESRIDEIIIKTAERKRISEEQLCKSWLSQMNSDGDSWIGIRNAGLCGRECPRGVIFTILLKLVCKYYIKVDELGLVQSFRNKFADDAGLNGCLLEREEILRLKRPDHYLETALFTLGENVWELKRRVNIPLQSGRRCIFWYDETASCLNADFFFKLDYSRLCLVTLPPCFDVIDVVLVDCSNNSPTIYGIQVTRSKRPFSNHHTFDTCSDNSKKRLDALWAAITNSLKLNVDNVKIVYVMVAPNCEDRGLIPPPRHSNEFLFSPPPPEITTTTGTTTNIYPQRGPRKTKYDSASEENSVESNERTASAVTVSGTRRKRGRC